MLKRKKISFKSKKSEDVTWVLDGVVGFLQSPIWTVPIMNFVEDNCACFEIKEENKFEYTDIHLKYKDLVEELLFKYIKELHISEELFSEACNKHKSSIDHVEGIFEYVWAADDFLLFKTIMARHNVELDIQAMSLVQNSSNSKNSTIPSAPSPSGLHTHPYAELDEPDHEANVDFILAKSKKEFEKASSVLHRLQEQDEYNLQRAIEFSKQETERLNKLAELEKEMLEKAIRLSLQSMKDVEKSDESSSSTKEVAFNSIETAAANVVSNEQSPKPQLVSTGSPSPPHPTVAPAAAAAAVKQSPIKSPKKSKSPQVNSPTRTLAPLKQRNATDVANDWIHSAKLEQAASTVESKDDDKKVTTTAASYKPTPVANGIDPDELAKRKEYLKQQREKILQAKRQQRQEELANHQQETGQTAGNAAEEPTKNDEEKQKMLNARRALAERLKREVIGKKK